MAFLSFFLDLLVFAELDMCHPFVGALRSILGDFTLYLSLNCIILGLWVINLGYISL